MASLAILPVILCGGSGTRLWPMSRESMPKQFARLVDASESTFQATARRVGDAAVFARPAVIAAAESRFIVAEQLAQAGMSADIILEPEGRDSSAAVAVAALHAAKADPEAVVLIMAADHVIGDVPAFAAAVRAVYTMTLGIEPTRPATDYGYIRRGGALPEAEGAFAVARFVEKPDAGTQASARLRRTETHVADTKILPGVKRWSVGDITLTVLNDGWFQGSLD
ncbi:hypothetical protein MKK68_29135, partial [Methylobacterium sp. E-016]|uniref:sugar phosphate nucleotidyltransferase n=1 Tax=Methylobacterium sp. E-016 TaxID=2836556 RepID=UPI001FBA7FCA